jgi:hypothetical protein
VNRTAIVVLALGVGLSTTQGILAEALAHSASETSDDCSEFNVWNAYVSQLRRVESTGGATDSFLSWAKQDCGLSPSDLSALLTKGKRLNWLESQACALPAQPVRTGGPILPPQLRAMTPTPPPQFPGQGLQSVILEATITRDGRLIAPRVLRSVQGRDQEALERAQAWTWYPALLCGRPVDSLLLVPVPVRVPTDSGGSPNPSLQRTLPG